MVAVMQKDTRVPTHCEITSCWRQKPETTDVISTGCCHDESPKGVSEGGTGRGKGHERKMRKGAKAFGMLAKETAVSLSRCVRQSGYISRVNDSDISISVSVRWLSLPTLPG